MGARWLALDPRKYRVSVRKNGELWSVKIENRISRLVYHPVYVDHDPMYALKKALVLALYVSGEKHWYVCDWPSDHE